jgi:hypothetical protein
MGEVTWERIDNHLEFDQEHHLFRLDGRLVPSFTQSLVMSGLVDTTWFTEYGRQRGSAVHTATHYFDEGDLDPNYFNGEQSGYLEAWDNVSREFGFKWFAIEKPVYSIPLQVAGIPDRVGMWNRDIFGLVCEIKTGKLYPITGIQLSLQQACIYPPPRHRIGIRLYNSGRYELKEFKSRHDWDVAKAALTITHWLIENRRSK